MKLSLPGSSDSRQQRVTFQQRPASKLRVGASEYSAMQNEKYHFLQRPQSRNASSVDSKSARQVRLSKRHARGRQDSPIVLDQPVPQVKQSHRFNSFIIPIQEELPAVAKRNRQIMKDAARQKKKQKTQNWRNVTENSSVIAVAFSPSASKGALRRSESKNLGLVLPSILTPQSEDHPSPNQSEKPNRHGGRQ